jgi:uncharacterized membrane protein
MNTTVSPSATGQAAAGRDLAWVAYALHTIGYLLPVVWPALIGLVLNYVKRGAAPGGYVDSHHGWMIRTFWYGLLWYALCLGALLASAWPWVKAALLSASAPERIVIEWGAIFSSVGAAVLGGTGLLITWCWLLYRVLRGMIRLADARPMP